MSTHNLFVEYWGLVIVNVFFSQTVWTHDWLDALSEFSTRYNHFLKIIDLILTFIYQLIDIHLLLNLFRELRCLYIRWKKWYNILAFQKIKRPTESCYFLTFLPYPSPISVELKLVYILLSKLIYEYKLALALPYWFRLYYYSERLRGFITLNQLWLFKLITLGKNLFYLCCFCKFKLVVVRLRMKF